MNGFEKRRKQKQESILNAALELFKQKGFNKTSIADVAKFASVSESSVYNFYINKENLKQVLMKKLIYDDYINTVNILENSESVPRKLEELLILKVEFLKNFSWDSLLESSGVDFIKEYIGEDNYQKYNNAIVILIEIGKREGVFDDSISTDAMITYLDIIRYYFINNPTVFNKNSDFSREIYTLFLNAFLKK